MLKNYIEIKGAREHNLKDIDINIPRDQLVVVCGPSGSGKSTLAFDLIYAEGQRRYVESLSTYARQFLPQMDKPAVDKIEGLSPAISLEQQSATRNPRSTVGTVTEIYDFLRVFYARLATMYCPSCGNAIAAQAADEIIDSILQLPEGSRCMILAPLSENKKGSQQDRLKKLKAQGFVRVRLNGEIIEIDDAPTLDKNKRHNLDLVVDRLVIKEGIRSRLADSVELALSYGSHKIVLLTENASQDNLPQGASGPSDSSDSAGKGGTLSKLSKKAASGSKSSSAEQGNKWLEQIFSTENACPNCQISMPSLSPQLFSFNSPQGACSRCLGLGSVEYFEPALIAPNKGLSIQGGALLAFKGTKGLSRHEPALEELGEAFGFTLSTPLADFSKDALSALFYGASKDAMPLSAQNLSGLARNWLGGSVQTDSKISARKAKLLSQNSPNLTEEPMFEGIIAILEKGMNYGDAWRELLSRFRQNMPCPACNGARLRPEALAAKINNLNIADFCNLPVTRALNALEGFSFKESQQVIFKPLLTELSHRLSFMENVGLDYLSLARSMNTLSGGEVQRIRLASQLGTGLVGVTYVLDEPSIGLHPKDNERLLHTLRGLQKRGNTVLVVEHDESTIREADTVIEMGPGSGALGGEVVFNGPVKKLLEKANTLTAKYLRGDISIPVPAKRRSSEEWLTFNEIATNNIKNITCKIPLGTLTCVTGPSGSGKSSLVVDTIYKHLALARGIKVDSPGIIGGTANLELIERVVAIDQTPIGRTPRSNPATYTKVFDEIRNIFSLTPDAKMRGYKPGRFSFNVKGGRCEACSGDGQVRVEMHFLPDVYVTCDVCKGLRYNTETLEVHYKNLNIAEVLNLTIAQAKDFFTSYPTLARRFAVLSEVGLDYLTLGQPATTLSGGEAQRIKISRELGKKDLPGTIYILDEPTTGLHMHEVGKLITVLHKLVDGGATVLVIEHNPDVIMSADYVIDMGPGGGEKGGEIVATGTPEEIKKNKKSITGSWL